MCRVDLSSDRRARLKLKGNAVGVNVVYSELFDSLMDTYTEYPISSLPNYLSNEPAFVCKSCFAVFKRYCDVKASIQSLKEKLLSSDGEAARKVSDYDSNDSCMYSPLVLYQLVCGYL